MAGRVISLLAGQFKGQERTDAKLQRICHMLIKIHSATEEARGRQITNYGTLEWLSELNDGLYQGRYLLETVGCREEHETGEDDDHADKVGVAAKPFSLSLFNPAKRARVAAGRVRSLLSRHDVGVDERIDRVVQILETISGDLREFLMLLQSCQPIHRHLATNIFVEGQMFGRHVEKERTINFLLDDGDAGELGVLPIVGDVGVGKTTLAQHVCDDERVRGHFPIIMFSNFSCTFVIARGEPTFVLESKHAVEMLKSSSSRFMCSRRKRFLMVFEDVNPSTTWETRKQDHGHHQRQGRGEQYGDGAADQPEGDAASGVLVLLQGARVRRQGRRGGPEDGGGGQGDREEAQRVLLRGQDRRSRAESPSRSQVLVQGLEEQHRGSVSAGRWHWVHCGPSGELAPEPCGDVQADRLQESIPLSNGTG